MVKRNVSFYERKKLSQNQELCTNGKVHIMDFFGWRKRWYYGFLGLKGDHSNEANKNKNFQLIASTKNNLKIAEKPIVQDIVLAMTTCHTLLLGLESALLLGLVVAWKYIFQVQVMFVWARHKSLYIHINTIYVNKNQQGHS